MRTTVTLPPRVHARARKLAAQRGVSMSTVIAELTIRGLAQLDEPVHVEIDPSTALPVLRVGRRVTSAQVAALIDDDA